MKNILEYSWWEKHSRKFEFASLAFLLLVMILYIVDGYLLKSYPSRTLSLRIIFRCPGSRLRDLRVPVFIQQ